MPEFGIMGVDWEERIDFDRLRRERLQRAKDALDSSDLNALFVIALKMHVISPAFAAIWDRWPSFSWPWQYFRKAESQYFLPETMYMPGYVCPG